MSTTQRSESMNKIFKDFMHSSMLVSDFVYQYEKTLDKRYQSQKEKDVKTKTTKAILKTGYKIEAEAAKVYARKIFKFFQEEFFSCQKQQVSKYHEEGGTEIYKVVPNGKESPTYEVALDVMRIKAACSFCKFEFFGILCRHILVLYKSNRAIQKLRVLYKSNRAGHTKTTCPLQKQAFLMQIKGS